MEPQDLTGAVLNQRFRLLRRVGYGGMGTVYATDQHLEGVPIAVKMLNADAIENPDVVARFIDEGRLCRRLDHPNLIRIFDVEVAENGCPYLAMELLTGVPLSAYTAHGGRIPLEQTANILLGILAGLAHAHAAGIVHRDLKPDNVFLARTETGQFYVKVLDFGIAKVMDLIGGMGKRTRTGALLGTPAYMSPEQIRSTKDVDARSDLFSVGVMAYEMLSGRPAFPAPTEFAKLAAVLNSQPPALETLDPAFASVGPFILRALQKDRSERFQTADEMACALTAVVSSEQLPVGGVAPLPAPPAANLASTMLTPMPHAARSAQVVLHLAAASRAPSMLTQPLATTPMPLVNGQSAAHLQPDGIYGRLSQLPAVPSLAQPLWMQTPQSQQLAPSVAVVPLTPAFVQPPPPGGATLNSRRTPPAAHGSVSVEGMLGTMPSRDLPVTELPHPSAAGVPHRIVAVLVLLAFAFGAVAGALLENALTGH